MAESSPKPGIFAKAQKTISRTKTKVLQNLGRAEKTTDDTFTDNVQKIDKQQEVAHHLQKELKNYVHCAKDLCQASKSLQVALQDTYEAGWTDEANFKSQVQTMELLWNDFVQNLQDSTMTPLHNYLVSFPVIKNKVAKRGRKMVDYDNARHHLESLQAAKKKDDLKIQKAQEDLKEAKRIYEDLNNELHIELPDFYNSRVSFYAGLFTSLFGAEYTFHTEIGRSNGNLGDIAQQLTKDYASFIYQPKTPLTKSVSTSSDTGLNGDSSGPTVASSPGAASPSSTLNSPVSSTSAVSSKDATQPTYTNDTANESGTLRFRPKRKAPIAPRSLQRIEEEVRPLDVHLEPTLSSSPGSTSEGIALSPEKNSPVVFQSEEKCDYGSAALEPEKEMRSLDERRQESCDKNQDELSTKEELALGKFDIEKEHVHVSTDAFQEQGSAVDPYPQHHQNPCNLPLCNIEKTASSMGQKSNQLCCETFKSFELTSDGTPLKSAVDDQGWDSEPSSLSLGCGDEAIRVKEAVGNISQQMSTSSNDTKTPQAGCEHKTWAGETLRVGAHVAMIKSTLRENGPSIQLAPNQKRLPEELVSSTGKSVGQTDQVTLDKVNDQCPGATGRLQPRRQALKVKESTEAEPLTSPGKSDQLDNRNTVTSQCRHMMGVEHKEECLKIKSMPCTEEHSSMSESQSSTEGANTMCSKSTAEVLVQAKNFARVKHCADNISFSLFPSQKEDKSDSHSGASKADVFDRRPGLRQITSSKDYSESGHNHSSGSTMEDDKDLPSSGAHAILDDVESQPLLCDDGFSEEEEEENPNGDNNVQEGAWFKSIRRRDEIVAFAGIVSSSDDEDNNQECFSFETKDYLLSQTNFPKQQKQGSSTVKEKPVSENLNFPGHREQMLHANLRGVYEKSPDISAKGFAFENMPNAWVDDNMLEDYHTLTVQITDEGKLEKQSSSTKASQFREGRKLRNICQAAAHSEGTDGPNSSTWARIESLSPDLLGINKTWGASLPNNPNQTLSKTSGVFENSPHLQYLPKSGHGVQRSIGKKPKEKSEKTAAEGPSSEVPFSNSRQPEPSGKTEHDPGMEHISQSCKEELEEESCGQDEVAYMEALASDAWTLHSFIRMLMPRTIQLLASHTKSYIDSCLHSDTPRERDLEEIRKICKDVLSTDAGCSQTLLKEVRSSSVDMSSAADLPTATAASSSGENISTLMKAVEPRKTSAYEREGSSLSSPLPPPTMVPSTEFSLEEDLQCSLVADCTSGNGDVKCHSLEEEWQSGKLQMKLSSTSTKTLDQNFISFDEDENEPEGALCDKIVGNNQGYESHTVVIPFSQEDPDFFSPHTLAPPVLTSSHGPPLPPPPPPPPPLPPSSFHLQQASTQTSTLTCHPAKQKDVNSGQCDSAVEILEKHFHSVLHDIIAKGASNLKKRKQSAALHDFHTAQADHSTENSSHLSIHDTLLCRLQSSIPVMAKVPARVSRPSSKGSLCSAGELAGSWASSRESLNAFAQQAINNTVSENQERDEASDGGNKEKSGNPTQESCMAGEGRLVRQLELSLASRRAAFSAQGSDDNVAVAYSSEDSDQCSHASSDLMVDALSRTNSYNPCDPSCFGGVSHLCQPVETQSGKTDIIYKAQRSLCAQTLHFSKSSYSRSDANCPRQDTTAPSYASSLDNMLTGHIIKSGDLTQTAVRCSEECHVHSTSSRASLVKTNSKHGSSSRKLETNISEKEKTENDTIEGFLKECIRGDDCFVSEPPPVNTKASTDTLGVASDDCDGFVRSRNFDIWTDHSPQDLCKEHLKLMHHDCARNYHPSDAPSPDHAYPGVPVQKDGQCRDPTVRSLPQGQLALSPTLSIDVRAGSCTDLVVLETINTDVNGGDSIEATNFPPSVSVISPLRCRVNVSVFTSLPCDPTECPACETFSVSPNDGAFQDNDADEDRQQPKDVQCSEALGLSDRKLISVSRSTTDGQTAPHGFADSSGSVESVPHTYTDINDFKNIACGIPVDCLQFQSAETVHSSRVNTNVLTVDHEMMSGECDVPSKIQNASVVPGQEELPPCDMLVRSVEELSAGSSTDADKSVDESAVSYLDPSNGADKCVEEPGACPSNTEVKEAGSNFLNSGNCAYKYLEMFASSLNHENYIDVGVKEATPSALDFENGTQICAGEATASALVPEIDIENCGKEDTTCILVPENDIGDCSEEQATCTLIPENDIEDCTEEDISSTLVPENDAENSTEEDISGALIPENDIENCTEKETSGTLVPKNDMENCTEGEISSTFTPENDIENCAGEETTSALVPENDSENFVEEATTHTFVTGNDSENCVEDSPL